MAWTHTARRHPAPARSLRPVLSLEMLEDRCLLNASSVALPPLAPPARFASDAALQQFVIDSAVARWSSVFGTQFPQATGNDPIPLIASAGPASPSPTTAAVAATAQTASDPSTTFSQTNNQVAGVDEGDIVQTDGAYLYLLNGTNLTIVDGRLGHDPTVVSRTAIEGNPLVEYLDGHRVTVLSMIFGDAILPPNASFPIGGAIPNLRPLQLATQIKVTVFDVTNPTAPRVVQASYLDGNYVESRAVGNDLYVVVQNDLGNLAPAPTVTYTGSTGQYETEAQYRADLAAHLTDASFPHVYTEAGPGQAQTPIATLADPASTYKPTAAGDTTLLSVAAFDVSANSTGPIATVSAVGSFSSTVYASADNLYVLTPQWPQDGSTQTTVIDRFALDSGHPDLTAVGQVPGQVLNQFSLDESGGAFRVATTTYSGSNTSNNVYVLTEKNGVLQITGALEDLAPGERITSARFVGDLAYLDTFRQTDPLFLIDLHNPSQPHVAGELQIPGFSGYLQPLDATHLLGIGHDADPTTGRPGGLQLSLFDISNPNAPTLVSHYTIALGGWSWSDAEFNAHAVGYYPEYDVLALPVNGYAPQTWQSESALLVFHLDVTSGFDLLGQIDQSTPVRRSVRLGDRLFAVASDGVTVAPILHPQAAGKEVPLSDPDLSASAVAIAPAVGVPFSGVVSSFTLTNPDTVTATINWGDGQFSPGTVQPNSQGGYDVVGSHTYSTPGAHNLSVSLDRSGDMHTSVATTANVSGDPNQRYVAQLYRDLLGREADAGGLGSWVQMLQQGGDRATVVREIERSIEYRTRVIQDLYEQLLGRSAETTGLNAWLTFLANGGTTDQLRAYILASDEFYAQQGQGSSDGFLHALYENVLHRDIDATGRAAWGQALAADESRYDVALAVLDSVEAETQRVQGWYSQLLHRSADNFGVQTFVGALQHGAASQEVLLDILVSGEYVTGT
jgi:uncharacterized secreted protein with C-terminal beta-propeller domain